MRSKLIEECYRQSKKLLVGNSNRYGVAASSVSVQARKKLYTNIFGRDACICALGMVASGDKKLIQSARNSLITLAKHQTSLGQIPSSVNPVTGENLYYFLGSIDSNLWWLIAMDFYTRHSADKELKIKLLKNIKKALLWLRYQDQNNDGLLEQGEACSWTDDMPDNGRVLYSNVLWYKALASFGRTKDRGLTFDGLNTIFMPHAAKKDSSWLGLDLHHRGNELRAIKEIVDDVPYYLHYISYRHGSDRMDVYANSLAIIFGIAKKARREAIIRFMRQKKVSRKYPVVVLTPPIKSKDFDWRPNMDRETCANQPYQYHNGGIWPFVGCFYAMALHKAGKKDLAARELRRAAEANKVNNWQFNEWFHARTGQPMGMAGQSWNAGAFLLAYHYLEGDIKF